MTSTATGQIIAPALSEIGEFAGYWNVRQQLWKDPSSDPAESSGRAHCQILLGGFAVLTVTEITEGANRMGGVALATHDEERNGLKLAWIDTFPDGGITIMTGTATKTASSDRLREQFPAATSEREWRTSIGSPDDNAGIPADVAQKIRSGAAGIPVQGGRGDAGARGRQEGAQLRLVENKVSDDHWVLEIFASSPGGEEFLVQENTYQRA
jgi:hypothetical protein